jgi:glycosyltransferase EpsF
MLKVLQVTGLMNRGGAEAMLMDILRNKSHDVHFDFLINNDPRNLTDEGSFDREILSYGCEIRHIGSQLRLGPVKYICQFRQVVEELRPDVVHIHLNAKCGLIALAAHLAGVKKIITHCHADIKFRGSLLSRIFNETEVWLQKWLIGWFATDFWGCSIEANKRLYRNPYFDRSVVIPNAISCDAYAQVSNVMRDDVRNSYNLPSDAIILGNVGRIVPHKGIANIVDVIFELKNRNHNAHFVIVGRNDAKDYVEDMKKHAEALNVIDRIHFIGERSDIPTIMSSFDVFVGPALREGFGLVAVEAQAACIPCVLYKGFPKAVDMGMGLTTFVNDFNAVTWANYIETALQTSKPDKTVVLNAISAHGFDAKRNALKVCEQYKAVK